MSIADDLKKIHADLGAAIELLETPTEKATADPDAPSIFLPGAPPRGRRIEGRKGIVLHREDWPNDKFSASHAAYPHGLWVIENDPAMEYETGRGMSWHSALLFLGPFKILPLTEQEQQEAVLYGPPGERWGNPDVACPYYLDIPEPGVPPAAWRIPCALGIGHVGPHIDRAGNSLNVMAVNESLGTTKAAVTEEDLKTPCTCRHPEAHRAGCPRYDRIVNAPWTGLAEPKETRDDA